MQTRLPETLLATRQGKRADEILRNCVHCGFCTATCPTYQLLGDELDGPRGRIYQIKQVLEGANPGPSLQQHLDRCLSCRSCETTCPSGVAYAELLEIGRAVTEQRLPRSPMDKFQRYLLRKVLPYPSRFALLFKTGSLLKGVLPRSLARKIPVASSSGQWQSSTGDRKILVLDGCVQSVLTPDVNELASQVFSRLGIALIREQKAGCCGAVSQHLSADEEAKQFIRQNIDAWWPHIEAGVEAIISTASGCGLMLHEYAKIMVDDLDYADKAKKISSLVKDPVQILAEMDLSALAIKPTSQKIAFHPPCTLQHGMQQSGAVEKILTDLGFSLVDIKDKHLCCGSAGTYSILQPELSSKLQENKLKNLLQDKPDLIVTANIGCQLHLQQGTGVPVKHWLSLLV